MYKNIQTRFAVLYFVADAYQFIVDLFGPITHIRQDCFAGNIG